MTDNVPITAGTGTSIAADDIGSVFYQRVKPALGADGTAVDAIANIGVAGTGVQRVTVATDDPLHYAFDVVVTPTVTNGAYSAGDIVGALMTFAVARANDEKVIITGAQVTSKAAVTPALTLILFSADPTSTTKTDNAAYSLSAADAFKVVAAIPITALYDHGTPNSWAVDGLFIPATPVSGSQNIYGLLIDATGVTLTSTSDIQVRLRGVGA